MPVLSELVAKKQLFIARKDQIDSLLFRILVFLLSSGFDFVTKQVKHVRQPTWMSHCLEHMSMASAQNGTC